MTGTTTDDHSLCKRQRLVDSSAFDSVFRNGVRSTDRFFTILYCDNKLGYPRLGFAVSKKRVRKAVGRNQIRRLTRESFRIAKARLGSIDVVVMARSAAAVAANEEIFGSLQKHWRQMEKIRLNGSNESTFMEGGDEQQPAGSAPGIGDVDNRNG